VQFCVAVSSAVLLQLSAVYAVGILVQQQIDMKVGGVCTWKQRREHEVNSLADCKPVKHGQYKSRDDD